MIPLFFIKRSARHLRKPLSAMLRGVLLFCTLPKFSWLIWFQNIVLYLHCHRGIRVRDDNPFCFGSFEPLQFSHRISGGFFILRVRWCNTVLCFRETLTTFNIIILVGMAQYPYLCTYDEYSISTLKGLWRDKGKVNWWTYGWWEGSGSKTLAIQ